MKAEKNSQAFEEGSGNVFADLRLDDADARFARAFTDHGRATNSFDASALGGVGSPSFVYHRRRITWGRRDVKHRILIMRGPSLRDHWRKSGAFRRRPAQSVHRHGA
jgi:hypothetical protein